MLAANYTALRNNLKGYCDQVCDTKDTLIVTRRADRNVVMMSLERYNELEKLERNAQYLAMLAESDRQLREGKVVVKTMEELEAMAE
jgi:antitoxin YefM